MQDREAYFDSRSVSETDFLPFCIINLDQAPPAGLELLLTTTMVGSHNLPNSATNRKYHYKFLKDTHPGSTEEPTVQRKLELAAKRVQKAASGFNCFPELERRTETM